MLPCEYTSLDYIMILHVIYNASTYSLHFHKSDYAIRASDP